MELQRELLEAKYVLAAAERGRRTLLASADGTPIGGFTYCSRILTIQPHPEFSPEVAGTIYDRRAGRIGRDSAARAVASLDVPLDVERVAGWIVTALRS